MKNLRRHKYLFALLALLLVFAACKGESPTAPPVTGGGGGNGTPPTGATVTLTVSNATPLTDSTTIITATVASNNQPVPNGTAVEFQVSPLGQFQDSGTSVTIRTTTNGVATAVLTSSTAGATLVTAVVNNVTRTATVTFQNRPVTPVPPDTSATITSVAPSVGRIGGGELVTITGTNFRAPVRVLFNFANGVSREAVVVSVTPTAIQVLTPQVDVGAGQTLDATIVVINEMGSAAEQRITAGTPFTYRRDTLTPTIVTVSPDSGPVIGGTRITIFGQGFEAPVQVSFSSDGGASWAQMQIINTTFSQIVAVTPTARDVTPNGSGTLTGPVDLRVLNINSGTNNILTGVFRYTPKMQITAFGPGQGTSLGGTEVVIDGIGFEPPVAVSIGGVAAQPIRVSGTQIRAVTSALASPCGGSSGPVIVTNVDNGDTASTVTAFTYIGVQPLIVGVTAGGAITPGSALTVSVQNPGVGNVRFSLGGRILLATPSVSTAGTGLQTFTITIPTTGFTFPSVSCTPAGPGSVGTQFGGLQQALIFTNVTTVCDDELTIDIDPPAPNPCIQPAAAATFSASGPTCSAVGNVVALGAATGSLVITVTNSAATGSQSLTVTPGLAVGTNATATISPAGAATLVPGASTTFTLTADPTAAGAFSGSVTFTTNDPTKPTVSTCISGTGT